MKIILLMLLLASQQVYAEENQKVLVIRVLDGDTFEITNQCTAFESMRKVRVRMNRINSPEIHTKCLEEKQKGLEAKAVLSNKILNKTVTLKSCKNDKFARWLCEVEFDGENISDFMLKSNNALPYNGEKKPPNQCNTK